jgi:hypothetical protein
LQRRLAVVRRRWGWPCCKFQSHRQAKARRLAGGRAHGAWICNKSHLPLLAAGAGGGGARLGGGGGPALQAHSIAQLGQHGTAACSE